VSLTVVVEACTDWFQSAATIMYKRLGSPTFQDHKGCINLQLHL